MIRTALGSAEHEPGEHRTRRPTLKSVATAAGVSAATLEHVQEIVARLGYESSLVATSMRRRRTRN